MAKKKKAKAKREKDPAVRGWKTLPTIPLSAEEYQRMQEDKARVGAETWAQYYDMLIAHGVGAPCREEDCQRGPGMLADPRQVWDDTNIYEYCIRCRRLRLQEGE